MNLFIAMLVLLVAIASAFRWPVLQPDHILVHPDRIENPVQYSQLNTFINEAALTGRYFEQTINLDWADYYILRSRRATDGALRPYHFHRFEMPNGEFRVMCRVMPNWIKDLADTKWHQTMRSVTNVFAFSLLTYLEGDHNDVVCQFVSAADDREAACLLFLHQHNLISFPEAETVPRVHHHKKEKLFYLFENDTEQLHPHHKRVLTGKYCVYFWLTPVAIIACGLMVLVFLGLVGCCVFWLVTKARSELSKWQFCLRYLRRNGGPLLSSARNEIELRDIQPHRRNSRSIHSLTGEGLEVDEV